MWTCMCASDIVAGKTLAQYGHGDITAFLKIVISSIWNQDRIFYKKRSNWGAFILT